MMTTSRKTTDFYRFPADHADGFTGTASERFTIRTSRKDTDGNFTGARVVAEPRNGVPRHIHANEG